MHFDGTCPIVQKCTERKCNLPTTHNPCKNKLPPPHGNFKSRLCPRLAGMACFPICLPQEACRGNREQTPGERCHHMHARQGMWERVGAAAAAQRCLLCSGALALAGSSSVVRPRRPTSTTGTGQCLATRLDTREPSRMLCTALRLPLPPTARPAAMRISVTFMAGRLSWQGEMHQLLQLTSGPDGHGE